MMLSPIWYYENRVKGKTIEVIKREIRRLKRHINKLKAEMEDPELKYVTDIHPSRDIRLAFARDYLLIAKMALEESGEVYKPTKKELKEIEFQKSIPSISEIKMYIRVFFEGTEIRTITINDELQLEVYSNKTDKKGCSQKTKLEISKEEFLQELNRLHIYEWKRNYVNRFSLDGTQWDLEICYSDGRKLFKSSGNNAYPYNFKQLLELMDFEETCYEELLGKMIDKG